MLLVGAQQISLVQKVNDFLQQSIRREAYATCCIRTNRTFTEDSRFSAKVNKKGLKPLPPPQLTEFRENADPLPSKLLVPPPTIRGSRVPLADCRARAVCKKNNLPLTDVK